MDQSKHRLVWLSATVFLASFSVARSDPPPGWILAGSNPQDYEAGIVGAGHTGSAAYLKSQIENPEGFGTLMQTFSAERYRGKRLRMSGNVKAADVENGAGLWMRIDGADPRKPLGFDNMQDRPILGTTDWQQYEVVLDIPHESQAIAFGVLLVGNGEVLLDDIRFDAVDESVAVTNTAAVLPMEPANLDFDRNR